MSALDDVAAERQRQINVEGWTPEHDAAEHGKGQLADAAACYAAGGLVEMPGSFQRAQWHSKIWPWAISWWKPGPDRRRQLVKAGALIVAEIERLDRATLEASPRGDALDHQRTPDDE